MLKKHAKLPSKDLWPNILFLPKFTPIIAA
jgi:hypothetical protein